MASFTITVVCVPSPGAKPGAVRAPAATAWLETTSDGKNWTRRGRVAPVVSPDPLRDVRVVSDAPGPPAYDVREVVLAN